MKDSCLYLKLKELINFSFVQLVVVWFLLFLFKLKFCNSSIPLALCQLDFELPNCSANSLPLILFMGNSQLKMTICIETTSSKLRVIINSYIVFLE